jgi:hypothetical protein
MDHALALKNSQVITPNQPDDYKEDDFPSPVITTQKYKNLSLLAAELLANGNSLTGTAGQCGIGANTLKYWLKTAHFSMLVEYKRTERREQLLSRIDNASHKNWFASAWLLERNKAFKGEFAQPKAQAGVGSINVQVNLGTSPVASEGITVEIGQDQGQDDE